MLLYRRRKYFQYVVAITDLIEQSTYPRISRRVWMRPRSRSFWEHVILGNFTEEDWIQNFRMSRETFEYLHTTLQDQIRRRDAHLRKAITTRHRLAITLWTLVTPSEYRTIAHLFGVARSTVCIIVHDTSQAIVDVLFKKYVRFPCGREMERTIQGFASRWQVPQCVGAIDGSHIPVSVPANLHTDYYN